MENFRFENTTRILFGRDTHKQVGEYVKPYADTILLVYGGGSIKVNGIYDTVVQSLTEHHIRIFELPGVLPNPQMSLVYQGIRICREENIRFILAVGGGSVIDSAKAVALGCGYEGDAWDFFTHKAALKDSDIKIGVVLTVPGAGSEASASAVISNCVDGICHKRDYSSNLIRPCFAIMNPELTMTLSKEQTMYSGFDILAHVMERYFTKVTHVELTDRLCEATMVTVINNLRILKEDLEDYNARAEIMWASTVAHSNLLSTGRRSDWASHMIEHEISALYDIPHGAGLAVIFPAWMKFVSGRYPDIFAQYGERVWNITQGTSSDKIKGGIEQLELFLAELGLPLKLREFGIENDLDFDRMASNATKYGTIGDLVKITAADIHEILKLAM